MPKYHGHPQVAIVCEQYYTINDMVVLTREQQEGRKSGEDSPWLEDFGKTVTCHDLRLKEFEGSRLHAERSYQNPRVVVAWIEVEGKG